MTDLAETIVHASCVTVQGRGVLITGASGSGKSALALSLMALGADLVADDRVILSLDRGRVMASAPVPIRGLIEARGIGLLNACAHGPVPLDLVVDLDRTEQDRLPHKHRTILLGQSLTLLYRVEGSHFPAALLQFLKAGRRGD